MRLPGLASLDSSCKLMRDRLKLNG
jgi:hypothetical protein